MTFCHHLNALLRLLLLLHLCQRLGGLELRRVEIRQILQIHHREIVQPPDDEIGRSELVDRVLPRDGHALHQRVMGGFDAGVRVSEHYATLGDEIQALRGVQEHLGVGLTAISVFGRDDLAEEALHAHCFYGPLYVLPRPRGRDGNRNFVFLNALHELSRAGQQPVNTFLHLLVKLFLPQSQSLQLKKIPSPAQDLAQSLFVLHPLRALQYECGRRAPSLLLRQRCP
ncbi:hypothetical protein Mapa_016342 [Marchantia paleacea]|nr:hypothetical protein Mapa_016342 [Marchantia paleacea]